MALTKVKEGDKITPKTGLTDLSERQQQIYESLQGQTIRIKTIHKPGKKATSQISGRKGSKTQWAEYVKIGKDGKEESEHKFLSEHDLRTYFGYTITEKTSRNVDL